jgi:beta-glucosidase
MSTVTSLAFSLSSFVNSALGLPSTRLVQGDETGDPMYYKSDFDDFTDVVAYREGINKRVGEESSVLLKNTNDALPLGGKITILGTAGTDIAYGGTGGGGAIAVIPPQTTTFKDAFETVGVEVNPTVWDFYTAQLQTGSGQRRSHRKSKIENGTSPVL